jgi:hypothetical protein
MCPNINVTLTREALVRIKKEAKVAGHSSRRELSLIVHAHYGLDPPLLGTPRRTTGVTLPRPIQIPVTEAQGLLVAGMAVRRGLSRAAYARAWLRRARDRAELLKISDLSELGVDPRTAFEPDASRQVSVVVAWVEPDLRTWVETTAATWAWSLARVAREIVVGGARLDADAALIGDSPCKLPTDD